jgi:hypothetical protein
MRKEPAMSVANGRLRCRGWPASVAPAWALLLGCAVAGVRAPAMAAKVTVGNRTLRFDGEKILME